MDHGIIPVYMPPREPDQIPLQDIPPLNRRTITPPGTIGGFTPNPGHPDHLAALRTYSTDLAEAMRAKQGSVVRIAIAEDERRRADRDAADPRSKKNMSLIALSITVIVIASAIVGGAFWYRSRNSTVTPEQQTLPVSLVVSDSALGVDVSGLRAGEVIQKIRDAANGIPTGTIKNIVPVQSLGTTKTILSAPDFIDAIGVTLPPELSRTLTDTYMLGSYGYDGSHLFVVLRGSAHDYMLAGMLAWEGNLVQDVGPLFGIDSSSAQNTTWKGELVQNRDAHVARDTSGTMLLFYTFIDPNTVVVSQDSKTLVEVVRRFGGTL